MYRFATLDPRPGADNTTTLAATGGVYGIEVTIPALAAQCRLGNLDPQHSGGQPHLAACVAALSQPLPPDGATLATVRPDADSVLAMAVFQLRACGTEDWDTAKIVMVGEADSAPSGAWVRDYTPPVEFAQASAVAMNHKLPIEDRVATLMGWLTSDIQLPVPQQADHSAIHVTLSKCGRYAVAAADGPAGRGAIAAGYRQAPVVVAVNQRFSFAGGPEHRKYTIARWNTNVGMDWDGMKKALAAEPGWGGSPSIVGSPQGVGSRLSLEEVCSIVEQHLPV